MSIIEAMKDKKKTPFGYSMQHLRALAGDTLGDMADRLGFGPAELSGYEWGREPWPADIVERIVDIYQLPEPFFYNLAKAYNAKTIGDMLTNDKTP